MTSGRGRGHVTHFYILGPMSSSELFKFASQIEDGIAKSTGVTHVKVLRYGGAFRVT